VVFANKTPIDDPAPEPRDAPADTSSDVSDRGQAKHEAFITPDAMNEPKPGQRKVAQPKPLSEYSQAERDFIYKYWQEKQKKERITEHEEAMEQVRIHDHLLTAGRKPAPPVRRRLTQDKPLTVHVVPHTHDDVGWRKTAEEYFTGGRVLTDERAAVAMILDTLIDELMRDPRRTFTYVEMKFFTMWYKVQDRKVQDKVKILIKSGQLEITQGGWTATDEACPNYQDLILNMHMGHSFLYKEFGIRPQIGWMIDAFGHSETNAALFADFGFEALFFSRMNGHQRQQFQKEKKSTFLWEPAAQK